jgi:MarR family transcriptional regulator, transcriptional regulator for hemolysin
MTNSSPTLGFMLHDTARLMRRRFDRLTSETGLTRAQFQLLAKVSRFEGINQAGLAELLEMEPITVGRTIDRLVAAGFVERRADPKDRRAFRIFMTDAAKPALDMMQTVAVGIYAEALEGFDEQESSLLMSLLARVHGNLSGAVPEAEVSALSASAMK